MKRETRDNTFYGKLSRNSTQYRLAYIDCNAGVLRAFLTKNHAFSRACTQSGETRSVSHHFSLKNEYQKSELTFSHERPRQILLSIDG